MLTAVAASLMKLGEEHYGARRLAPWLPPGTPFYGNRQETGSGNQAMNRESNHFHLLAPKQAFVAIEGKGRRVMSRRLQPRRVV